MTLQHLGIGALLLAGCVGSIDGGGASGGGSPPGNNPGPGPTPSMPNPGGSSPGGVTIDPSQADPMAAGIMPVRRLTAHEYHNTIRDLLGATAGATPPTVELASDRDPSFGFRRAGVVSTLETQRLRDAAEALAASAIKNLATLLPCTPASPADEAGCARQFVEQFGARAYRRPLVADEVSRLLAVYQQGRAALMMPFAEAIGLTLEAMLQSSPFLYRWELGPQAPQVEGNVIRLGPYEVASRLSYFLWSSMPDKALFEAAAARALDTPAQIEAQVRRMVADPKAREGIGLFFEEWLDLESLTDRDKDPQLYPEYNDALKTAMLAETRGFVSEVLFAGDGKLSTLLGASFSVIDESLARLYGKTGVTGTALKRVDLDPRQRSGLLTQASFLALTGSPEGSNPVMRGKEIYLHTLCKELPPPPPEVPSPAPVASGGTTRQRFAEHAANACASGCHKLFDGFGFAFENYDGIGKYRSTENGQPVDASGQVELDGVTRNFNDARGLSEIIAASPEAQRCFATQWVRFAFRRLESNADVASLNAMAARFTSSQLDVRELLVALATSRTFRYRSPNLGEVLP
jgi:hypothetical protein